MRFVRCATLCLPLVTALVATGCSATTTAAQNPAEAEISVPETPGPGVTAAGITVADRSYRDDSKATYDAIVAAYNAAGGIAGRKITMVAQAETAQSPGVSDADIARSDCLAVTEQPGGVFAVIGARPDPDFTSCLNEHGDVVIPRPGFAFDDRMFERSPYTAALGLSYERLAAGLAAQLQASGYLKDAKNVAVVAASGIDDSDSVAQKTLVPLLKSAGASNVTVTTVDAVASGNAASASAALKLKSIAPDRIVVFGSAVKLISVVDEVVKQHLAAPVAISDAVVRQGRFEFSGLSNAPESQRVQSILVNISTQSGAQLQQDRVNAANPAAVKCLKIMSDNHLASPSLALQVCESLDLLKAGLEKSGSRQVNAQAFAKGLNALSSFPSVSVYQAGFGPGRHDGAGATQLMKYSGACTCFEPAGSPMPVPATK